MHGRSSSTLLPFSLQVGTKNVAAATKVVRECRADGGRALARIGRDLRDPGKRNRSRWVTGDLCPEKPERAVYYRPSTSGQTNRPRITPGLKPARMMTIIRATIAILARGLTVMAEVSPSLTGSLRYIEAAIFR